MNAADTAALDAHLTALNRAGRRPGTIRDRRFTVRRFAAFVGALLDANWADVDRWCSALTAEGRTAHTVEGYRSNVHAFAHWAVDAGLIPRWNPLTEAEEDILDAHLRDMRRRGLRGPSVYNRRNRVEAFAEFLRARGLGLLDATPDVVEAWLDSHVVQDLSQATRVSYTANIRTFYGWLHRRGYITSDPAVDVQLPRRPHARPRPIPEAELRRALDAAGPEMRAWLVLGAYCGLRAMEIDQVRREDVLDHLPAPVLDVPNGKGGRPRKVPIPREVLAELGPFLTGRRGRLWNPGRADRPGYLVSIAVNAHLRDLGIPHTCHSLRHRYGTRAYQLSQDLRLVQELLGHSSPATTQIYTQFSQEHAADVVARLGADLAGAR